MSTRAQDLAPLDEPQAPPAPRPRRRIPRAAIAAAAVLAAAAAYHYLWPASGSAPAGYTTTAVDRVLIEQTGNATGPVKLGRTGQVGTYVSVPPTTAAGRRAAGRPRPTPPRPYPAGRSSRRRTPPAP